MYILRFLVFVLYVLLKIVCGSIFISFRILFERVWVLCSKLISFLISSKGVFITRSSPSFIIRNLRYLPYNTRFY